MALVDMHGDPINVSDMYLCAQCRRVHGFVKFASVRLLQHQSDCPRRKPRGTNAAPDPDDAWKNFDIHEVCCICRSCGAELLPSGSKWNVWFCGACKNLAILVGKYFEWPYLPIGRHSLQTLFCGHPLGCIRGIEAVKHPKKAAHEMCEGLKNLFAKQGQVASWAQQAIVQNLVCFGIPLDVDVPLVDYLRMLELHPIDRKTRFLQMCQCTGCPSWKVPYLGLQEIIESERPS